MSAGRIDNSHLPVKIQLFSVEKELYVNETLQITFYTKLLI